VQREVAGCVRRYQLVHIAPQRESGRDHGDLHAGSSLVARVLDQSRDVARRRRQYDVDRPSAVVKIKCRIRHLAPGQL